MKKLLLAAIAALSCHTLQAQTTLHKLIDSVGSDWVRLYSYSNKLYLGTNMVGGTHYEIDLNTYATTPVAEFPFMDNSFSYQSICHDFVVFNGRISKVMVKSGQKKLIAADNTSVDTLLSTPDYIANISQVGNTVFVTTANYVFKTDFTQSNTVLIDSFNGGPEHYFAGSNFYYYVKKNSTNSAIRDIIRTDGVTSTVLETVNGGNYYIDLIGEQNGDFYYAVTLNSSTPTIEIKKSTSTIPTTLVNTLSVGGTPSFIFGNSSITAAGLGKLFIMIKPVIPPYINELYAYDITAGTFTKLTDAATNNISYASLLNKAAFSDNYFYFYTTGSYRALWRTDGTIAGTSLYADTVDIRFYDPLDYYFSLSTNGIFCNDYPVAGIDTEPGTATDVEYHYGTSTGFNKFDLNASGASYPKDFAKINNKLYFLATETTSQFGKQSLFRVEGCGLPTGINNATTTSSQIEVYPNPSNGTFTVSGNDLNRIVILNMQGQLVQTQMLKGHTAIIDATMLPKGIYLLQVTDRESKLVRKISIY